MLQPPGLLHGVGLVRFGGLGKDLHQREVTVSLHVAAPFAQLEAGEYSLRERGGQVLVEQDFFFLLGVAHGTDNDAKGDIAKLIIAHGKVPSEGSTHWFAWRLCPAVSGTPFLRRCRGPAPRWSRCAWSDRRGRYGGCPAESARGCTLGWPRWSPHPE